MALNDRDIERVIQDALELEQAWLTELAQLLLQHLQAGEWSELDEVALLELQAEFERKVTTVNAKHQDEIQSGISEAVIETLLAAAVSDIHGLKRYYKQEPEPILEPKLTSIANQVAKGVSTTIRRRNVAMSDSAVRAWYTAAIQAMQDIQQNGLSFDRAISKAVESLGRSFRIRYASGKTTSPDVALRRLMTTEMSQAGGRMTLECMESYGHELAVTSTHYGARPSHAIWQGKPFGIHGAITVDGVDYPGMEELTDYGSVTGLKGVNCRHSIYPYYPGITELPDREFEAEKAKWGKSSNEYYEATRRQRELERRIRSSKGVIADMEQAGLGLGSPDYVQKRLVLGRQQRELKAFLSKNNLPRQPLREKAYGVAKQPRGLTVRPYTKQKKIDFFTIGRSVGAKALNFNICMKNGEYSRFVEGSTVDVLKIFAGKGSKPFRELRVRNRLVEQYGGNPEDWFHASGEGWLFDPEDGKIRRGEVHWMENEIINQRVEFYFKRWRDKK